MSYWHDRNDVSVLEGKVLSSVDNLGNEELIFKTECGHTYKMYHEQDCCESVSIEDICGDLSDLIGTPIVVAEQVDSDRKGFEQLAVNVIEEMKEEDPWGYDDSQTWTFYKFRTIKGDVTIRWLGTSNGYYSESVDFVEIK